MEFNDLTELAKNTKEDIKDMITERLKYPIINLYIFFLLMLNWDILIILFFYEGTALNRIKEIQNLNKQFIVFWVINLRVILPLLFAVVSCFIYPYLSYLIEKKLSKTNKSRIDNHFDLKDKTADRERQVIDKRNGNRSIEELNNQITILSNDKEKLLDENIKYSEEIKLKSQRVDELDNFIKGYKQNFKEVNESFDFVRKQNFEGILEFVELQFNYIKDPGYSPYYPRFIKNIMKELDFKIKDSYLSTSSIKKIIKKHIDNLYNNDDNNDSFEVDPIISNVLINSILGIFFSFKILKLDTISDTVYKENKFQDFYEFIIEKDKFPY